MDEGLGRISDVSVVELGDDAGLILPGTVTDPPLPPLTEDGRDHTPNPIEIVTVIPPTTPPTNNEGESESEKSVPVRAAPDRRFSLARLSTPRGYTQLEVFKVGLEDEQLDPDERERMKALRARMNRRGSIYRAPSSLKHLDTDAILSKAREMSLRMETEIDAYTAFTEVPLELVDDPMGKLTTIAQTGTWTKALKDTVTLLLWVNFYVYCAAALLIGVLFYKKDVAFNYPVPSTGQSFAGWPSAVQLTDWVLFTFGMAYAFPLLALTMFGWVRTKALFKYGTIPLFCLTVAVWMLVVVLQHQGGLYLGSMRALPGFAVVFSGMLLTGYYIQKYQNIPHFLVKFVVPFIATFFVVIVYYYIIPELWFSTDSDLFRVALRVVLHPLLFETAAYVTRASIRNLRGNHPSTTFIMNILIMALSAFYGRFLVSASSSSAWTLITAGLLALLELGLRLSVGARDKLLYGLRHSPEEVRARFHTIRSVRLRADLLYIDVFLENTAIIASSFTVWKFGLSGITFERAMQDMVIQLAIEYVTDLLVLYYEGRKMNIPVYEAWVTRCTQHKERWQRKLFFFLPITFMITFSFMYFLSAYFAPQTGFLSRFNEE